MATPCYEVKTIPLWNEKPEYPGSYPRCQTLAKMSKPAHISYLSMAIPMAMRYRSRLRQWLNFANHIGDRRLDKIVYLQNKDPSYDSIRKLCNTPYLFQIFLAYIRTLHGARRSSNIHTFFGGLTIGEILLLRFRLFAGRSRSRSGQRRVGAWRRDTSDVLLLNVRMHLFQDRLQIAFANWRFLEIGCEWLKKETMLVR